MAYEEYTGKSFAEYEDRVWELIENINHCMLTTWDGYKPRARPMAATPVREEHAIYMLTSASSPKIRELEGYPIITAGFADASSNKYVTITGHAHITNDREKIKEVWTPFLKAWWDSPDDPDLRLITVEPESAELWDSPHRVIAGIIMLSAAIAGIKPRVGEHAKLRI